MVAEEPSPVELPAHIGGADEVEHDRPATLEKFYNQPASVRGSGQKLAAFGWGAPASVVSDLYQFQTEQGLPHMPLSVVQVGEPGTVSTCTRMKKRPEP